MTHASDLPHAGDDPLQDRLRAELAPELEVLRTIGRGSMATVYLARDVALRRLVAVKVLDPLPAQDRVAARRFEREAQAAARMVHPHITAIHRVGRTRDGLPYLVMEYVDGRTLQSALSAAGPLDPSETRRILAALASALAAAHDRGIVHRDVRPGNVLIENGTGRVVLADFGLAALRETGSDAAERLTRSDQRLGDVAHMSPEQLLGHPVTGRTDVYALGVVGYELLTGRPPFDCHTEVEMMTAHLRREPPRLSDLRAAVPADLSQLLAGCLAKDPEHRPTAADVVRSLEAPRSPGEATAASGWSAFFRDLRRRKVYQVAAAYIVIAFGVLQAGDIVLPSLGVERVFFDRLVLIVLALFPAALVLAWMFDISGGGIARTRATEDTAGRARLVIPLAALLLSILGAALVGWWLLTRG